MYQPRISDETLLLVFYLSLLLWGARDGAVVRALASHQCGPGSNPGVDAICGLSLLLVLSLAPRGFSPGTPVFPSPQKPAFPNSNSTRNQVDEEQFVDVLPPNHYLFIHLFIYLSIYYLLLVGVWIPSLYLIFYFSVLGFQIKYSSCLINHFSVYGYWMKHQMPHV